MDLNSDGRINGIDQIAASFIEEGDLYDIESFTYDKNGNRTKLHQNGDVYTYIYGMRNRLTGILLKKKDSNTATEFITYIYDDNGNLTERNINREDGSETITFEYDTMNRLIKTVETPGSGVLTGVSTEYFYDNGGNRFIKKGDDGEITLYLRHGQIAVAMDIEINADQSTQKGKINRYILSGDLIAGRITRTVMGDDTAEDARSYYHLDHLNSTKMVTNEDGEVEADYIYRAFGEQLNELQERDATYTYGGKELDTSTNLHYFNARFYDATTGRYISLDPIKSGSNHYIYCLNNALSYTDPTGLQEIINTWKGENIFANQYEGSDQEKRDNLMAAQDDARNNPGYQPGVYTYCNQAAYDVVEDTGGDLSPMMGNETRGNRLANEAAQSLENSQATPSLNFGTMTELTPEEAHNQAGNGNTVIASWKNENGPTGHLATIRPTERAFNPDTGPLVSQVGGNMGVMPAIEAFGKSRLPNVKYYMEKTND